MNIEQSHHKSCERNEGFCHDASKCEACEKGEAVVEEFRKLNIRKAAPDLLEALKLAEAAMEHMGNALNDMDACFPEDEAVTRPAFEAVRAAIAKATTGGTS